MLFFLRIAMVMVSLHSSRNLKPPSHFLVHHGLECGSDSGLISVKDMGAGFDEHQELMRECGALNGFVQQINLPEVGCTTLWLPYEINVSRITACWGLFSVWNLVMWCSSQHYN